MKNLLTPLPLAALLTSAFILMSCSASEEADQAETYFDPLPVIEQSAPPPPVTPPPVFAPNVNATIVTLVREQNERIRELMRQIAVITERADLVADQLAHADSVRQILGSNETVPDSTLLGLLVDHNRGLASAVQKLQGAADQHRRMATELRAYKQAEYVAEREGPKPNVTFEQALTLVGQRKFDKAASALRALLNYGVRKDIADDCYFWLGVSYFQQRNLSDAVQAFDRVLDFRTSNVKEPAYLMLGQSYEQLGSPNLAKAIFEKGTRMFPTGTLRPLLDRKIALLN